MAFRILRFLGFPRALRGTRYLYPLYFVLSPRFLTLDVLENPLDLPKPLWIPSKHKTTISECLVLEELSNLLSFDPRAPTVPVVVEKPVEKPTKPSFVDALLSSEEKLRGVFLQKLKGKSSVESALSTTGVDLKDEIFANVLNRGNLGGAAMVSFFDWATKQPKLSRCLETYHTILKALGRRKFFGFMEEILLQMKKEGINPTPKTLMILMDSYVRARRVYKAVELFKRSEEFGCECNSMSFNVLMHCLCRRSHVRLANTLFNTLKGKVSHDTMTYNKIIGGWARLGRISKVEKNWLEMIADGLTPDCHTYSHYIEGLGRTGRIDDAVDVFDKMKMQGCIPDTCNYNAVIFNFISVGNLEKSMEYYKTMVEKNCSPDINTYTKLISALLKVRRVADALELFDEMLSIGFCPSTGMITSFVELLCSYGPPIAAMMVYKKSKKVGCRISLKAYKLLLMRLSRFGKCGMILKVWEEMQESGYSSDVEVYEYIVDGLCNIGNLDNAVLVVEESLRKGFCIGKLVYSKLNNKLLERDKVETAYRLFLKVKQARSCANAQRFWCANGWHF